MAVYRQLSKMAFSLLLVFVLSVVATAQVDRHGVSLLLDLQVDPDLFGAADPEEANVLPHGEIIQINAGTLSEPYVARDGTIWATDRFFRNGRTRSVPGPTYFNTDDTPLLIDERREFRETLAYDIPVPAGTYIVELLFTEQGDSTRNGPGLRVFNVTAEEVVVIEDYDIFALTGRRFSAIVELFIVNVVDGPLTLTFPSSVPLAKVNAIGVYPLELPSAFPSLAPSAAPSKSVPPVVLASASPTGTPTLRPSLAPTPVPTLTPTPMPTKLQPVCRGVIQCLLCLVINRFCLRSSS